MPGKGSHSKKIARLFEQIANAAAEDSSFARSVLQDTDVDVNESVDEVMGYIKRAVAQAKMESEESVRSSFTEKAMQEAERLRKKFGSAKEALRKELEGSKGLALQFRKLKGKASEEDAFQILIEKIELELTKKEEDE